MTVHLLDDWFDAIEAGLRDRVREFIQAMIENELETARTTQPSLVAIGPKIGRPGGAVENWPPPTRPRSS
jgi:hypothetical protein